MRMGMRAALVVLAAAVTPGCGQSQIHPSKEAYIQWETWPVTTPADVSFGDRFQPFRAEWSRTYRNMNGDVREDRVIVVAEEVAWYGRPAISVTYHDSGNLEATESNARTATVYLDKENLSLLRGIAPKTGTPEDYVTVSVGEGTVTRTAVTTATGVGGGGNRRSGWPHLRRLQPGVLDLGGDGRAPGTRPCCSCTTPE